MRTFYRDHEENRKSITAQHLVQECQLIMGILISLAKNNDQVIRAADIFSHDTLNKLLFKVILLKDNVLMHAGWISVLDLAGKAYHRQNRKDQYFENTRKIFQNQWVFLIGKHRTHR